LSLPFLLPFLLPDPLDILPFQGQGPNVYHAPDCLEEQALRKDEATLPSLPGEDHLANVGRQNTRGEV